MKYTLDRFEESFALLEQDDSTLLSVPREELPANAAEGSVLTCENGKWALLSDDTEQTAARIRSKMDRLWR